mgnify:CR=1 FL=1
MATIRLNRADIEAHIRKGDNCEGHYVLAVATDAGRLGIFWDARDAQWNPWPDGWLTISIPPLDANGDGTESERAKDLLSDIHLDAKAIESQQNENLLLSLLTQTITQNS